MVGEELQYDDYYGRNLEEDLNATGSANATNATSGNVTLFDSRLGCMNLTENGTCSQCNAQSRLTTEGICFCVFDYNFTRIPSDMQQNTSDI